MSRLAAIAAREYCALFRTPLGWIVIALYMVMAGVVFGASTLRPGQPASMRPFFEYSVWTLIVVAPAISMRLLTDEIRSGTIEPLLTAPVAEITVVVGKYSAAVGFLVTLLLPTLLYAVLLEALARPDYGPIAAGYLGLLLLGMHYLAVGTLVSSLTASQTLAFLGTLFTLSLVEIAANVAGPVAPEPIRRVLFALSVNERVADFARGLIDSSHVVFFLAGAAWFLVLASVVLESRRWR
jgi:ABC-2 type transport system permease protein